MNYFIAGSVLAVLSSIFGLFFYHVSLPYHRRAVHLRAAGLCVSCERPVGEVVKSGHYGNCTLEMIIAP